MASSADAVAKRMMHVADVAMKAQLVSVQKAAMAMKVAHTEGLHVDVPSGVLRNVGKKGAKLSVGFKIQGGTSSPSAIVEARGPWQIVNNPASPHLIQAKKATALKLPFGFRRSAHHPGHAGKRTWQKAQPAAEKAGTKELNQSFTKAVQEAFKG